MLENVMLGRYIPGNSVIHALDPRSKIIGSIVFFLIVFNAASWIDYTLLLVFLAILVWLTKVSFAFFWNGFKPMVVLIMITAVFQIFFVRSGDVLFQVSLFQITTGGIRSALYVMIRFVLIIGLSTVLSLTTNPLTMADAMESMLHPLRKINFPVHELSLILAIAMRFVPTILDEAQTIMNAQRARGVDFNEGNLIKRVKAFIPILIPLFASAIRRAEDLAYAMESRGYKGGEGRTKYRQLKWRIQDTLVFVVLTLLYVSIVWI